MRINEIDESDRVWAATKGIRIDIKSEITEMMSLLTTLVKLKSPYRTQQWSSNIQYVEDNLKEIINANFADDVSTHELKTQATVGLQEIAKLKAQL